MWQHVVQAFRQAAQSNRNDPLRRGNVVHLPANAQLLVAGDLHGHGRNLLKIQALAGDLASQPLRHVVLQELIHERHDDPSDAPVADRSHQVLTAVVRWQLAFPTQVHVIIGNHEMAQMSGQDILKSGGSVCRAFDDGVRDRYTDEAHDLLTAMGDYFRSLPLAVRSNDGVAVLHSLPADRTLNGFDSTIFHRELRDADFARSGSAYQLLWGRTFTRPAIDRIRSDLDAQLLVLGHQPQPAGVLVVDTDAIILASDHACGAVLDLPPGSPPDARTLAANAISLSSVSV